MLALIAKNECRQTLRDRRFWLLTALVWLLVLTATVVGFQSYRTLKAERETAAREARSQWLGQGDKNPHSAAHYGTYAFRPKSELSFVDFGIDSFVGTAIYLEGHRQNEARYSAAQDAGTLLRFGELTVAFVLQLLLPLLIVFLGFNAVSREREDNTLRLLLAQGIGGRALILGKITGLSGVMLLVLLPALLLCCSLLFFNAESDFTADSLVRSYWLILFYSLYGLAWVIGSVLVSAHSRSSARSLLVLVGFWMVACILIPKATANLGATLYPTPTRFTVTKALHEDVEKGLDGHNPADERVKALEKQVLGRYGVDSVSKLPINFDGLAMQEGEKYTSRVYARHMGELQTTFTRQNRVSDWASLINPYLAIRNLSMALAGSDYSQTVDFSRAAEAYRFHMVEFLNKYMRDHSETGDWKFKVNIWKTLPDFQYQPPSAGTVLSHYGLAIGSLLIWVAGGFLLVYRITNRLSPL